MKTGTILGVDRSRNQFLVRDDADGRLTVFLILEDRGGLQVGGKVCGALESEGEQELVELTSGQSFAAYCTGGGPSERGRF